jgi:hypothetical protein
MWSKFTTDLSVAVLIAFAIPFIWVAFFVYLSFVFGIDLKSLTPNTLNDVFFRAFFAVLPWTLCTFPVAYLIPSYLWRRRNLYVVFGILALIEFVAFFIFMRISGSFGVSGLIYLMSMGSAFSVLHYANEILVVRAASESDESP